MRWSVHRIWVAVPAILVAGTLAASCASRISGTATPPTGGIFQTYVAPKDGSGFSTQPMDQLQPLPPFDIRDPQDSCSWLSDWQTQLGPLGASKAVPAGSGCEFMLPNDEDAQVQVVGPYTKINQATNLLKPTTVAGLEGRYYSFTDEKQDTSCAVEVNTRSLYSIMVLGFNKAVQGGNRDAHCQIADKIAEAVVKKYVPLAGGQPSQSAIQQPDKTRLVGKKACDIVQWPAVLNADGLKDENPQNNSNAQGTTCQYQGKPGKVEVLLTSSTGGMAEAPTPDFTAKVTATKLGVLTARSAQTATSCAFAVQLASGQILQAAFTPAAGDPNGSSCLSAQAVVAVGVMDTITG